MHLVTTEQMRRLEQTAVDAGATWEALMEHAGWGVAQEALRTLGDARGRRVIVLVGPGNNGGDGLVAARHLHDAGAHVTLYLWNRSNAKSGKTAKNDVNWQRCRERVITEIDASTDETRDTLRRELARTDMVIDALLGMGISRRVEGALATIVEHTNAAERRHRSHTSDSHTSHTPSLPPHATHSHNNTAIEPTSATPPMAFTVLAIDVPTGIHSDNGAVMGVAIQADKTIATGLAKYGLFLYPGRTYAGDITLAEIGLPNDLVEQLMSETITAERAHTLLPARPTDSHKGTFGKVAVVAGSLHYPGAATLAVSGAARVGAGIVTLSTARSIMMASSRPPEITLLPLPEADIGVLGPRSAEELLKQLGAYQALLVGPGIGKEEPTRKFIALLLGIDTSKAQSRVGFQLQGSQGSQGSSESATETSLSPAKPKSQTPVGFHLLKADKQQEEPPEKEQSDDEHPITPEELPPTVLDADAINILAETKDWHNHVPKERFILTPHPGEMKRLLDTDTLDADLVKVATDAAAEWGQYVVLKAATTVIAAPDGRVAIHSLGNPALATAGTGDVLAGVIAGLLAQGLSNFDAAVLGVYLHAGAGTLVRDELGDTGALASDLLLRLPRVIKQIKAEMSS